MTQRAVIGQLVMRSDGVIGIDPPQSECIVLPRRSVFGYKDSVGGRTLGWASVGQDAAWMPPGSF
jgi:hypothetical protein